MEEKGNNRRANVGKEERKGRKRDLGEIKGKKERRRVGNKTEGWLKMEGRIEGCEKKTSEQ